MKPMPHTLPNYDGTVADKPAITWKSAGKRSTAFIFTHELDAHLAAKRLIDAECAAEYWKIRSERYATSFCEAYGWDTFDQGKYDKDWSQVDTWRRFAEHPHAFES